MPILTCIKRPPFLKDHISELLSVQSFKTFDYKGEKDYHIYPKYPSVMHITKTYLFKYIENFTTKKMKIFR